MGILAYKFLDSANLEIENDDLSTVLDKLADTLNSDFIKQYFDIWNTETSYFRKGFNKIRNLPEGLPNFADIEGPIRTYFPVSGVASVRTENYSEDFWNSVMNWITSERDNIEA